MAELAGSPGATVQRKRVASIDVLRGLVMIVMALDHVRDYFSNARFEPTDLSKTWPALFFTRWITHFCAPTFIFLAGTGAYLYGVSRGGDKRQLSRFLWTRGLWLIFVELTLVRFGWTFNWNYHTTSVFQVIWAIGASMIVLAALCRLPDGVIASFGIVLIVGHNALDSIKPESFGHLSWIWTILHVPGLLHPSAAIPLFVMYPLIPWIGVMACGYVFGRLYRMPAERRRPRLLALGAALTLAFVVLRAANLYGDPEMWSHQKSATFTFLSFLNCEKYPPSLLFLLMTLGPAILFLAAAESVRLPLSGPISVYGRVPFFYYVLHLPLAHFLGGLALFAKYGPVVRTYSFANPPPPDFGFRLAEVYAAWILVVLILYFPCRWYSRLKARSSNPLLSYL
jgi:uncharacterized membrane protein